MYAANEKEKIRRKRKKNNENMHQVRSNDADVVAKPPDEWYRKEKKKEGNEGGKEISRNALGTQFQV